MSLNVNRNLDDAFYRYKMPPLVAKVEGRGNGIKTVIVNMSDIAKALGRPAGYATKFFGCELGAQTQIEPENDRYIVNGQHESKRLQELLDGFIQKFVLCEKCHNPETIMVVTKAKKIEERCTACGHITACDMRHKLTTFILKNPPNDVAPKSSSKDKKSKAERRAGKAGKHDGHDEDGSHDDEEHAEASPAAATPTAPSPANADDDWSVDTSEEAVRARATASLSAGVAALTITDDLERSSTDRLQIFSDFLAVKLKESKFPAKEVLLEAERLDCKEKGVMAIIDLGFDSEEFAAKIKFFAPIIQRFTLENKKAQKYLLGGLEKYVARFPKLVDKFPNMLKAFYDLDILEEEALKEWNSKVSKKYISKELSAKLHEKSSAFMKWLEEAEEESSEEEDDLVEFDSRAAPAVIPKPAAAPAAASAPAAAEEDGEDDIDIDAI